MAFRSHVCCVAIIAVFAPVATYPAQAEDGRYHFRIDAHAIGMTSESEDPPSGDDTDRPDEDDSDNSPIVAETIVNEVDRPIPIMGGRKYVIWAFSEGKGPYSVELVESDPSLGEWIFAEEDYAYFDPFSTSHVGTHSVSFDVSDGETTKRLGPFEINVFDPREEEEESAKVGPGDVSYTVNGDVDFGPNGSMRMRATTTNAFIDFRVRGGGSYSFTPAFPDADTNWIHVGDRTRGSFSPDGRNVGKTYQIIMRVTDAFGASFWYFGPEVTFTP